MGRKTIVQICGTALSALNTAIPMGLDAQGLFPQWSWQYHAIIGFVALLGFMIWMVWDRQMQINKYEERIRLTARPGHLAINLPSKTEQPLARDEFSINTTIYFEVWSDIDAHTANLVLNLIVAKHRYWWQLWKVLLPKFNRVRGLRIEGQDTADYRKIIRCSDTQPFQGHATFKWRGKLNSINKRDSLLLELVLGMGSPKGICRAVVDPRLYERGATSPL